MEVDTPVVGGDGLTPSGQHQAMKTQKRKRQSVGFENLSPEIRDAQIKSTKQEIDGLFRFYREMMDKKADLVLDATECCASVNPLVSILIEEMEIPLSRLVDEIYPKVREKLESVTVAAVKSAVVFVGQRVMYGMPNEDADVLEDNTESCLWCWETRDLKMMPKSVRGLLKIRRTCRRKIHDRITALYEMMGAMQKFESDGSCGYDLRKASEKLSRVLGEADIRLLVDNMLQKNNTEMGEKEVKREEKMLIKQLERNKREAEKERKRTERETEKERLLKEREIRRLQDEAEKEEKLKEKEASETRKRLRKQQDDEEKEQRRLEKEQAELKKHLVIQKQASIMERFVKRSKTTPSTVNDMPSGLVSALASSSKKSESAAESVTESMDYAFSSTFETSVDDLRKTHLSTWHQLGHSIRLDPKQCWGRRRKSKTALIAEIKLSSNKVIQHDNEVRMTFDEMPCNSSDATISNVKKLRKRKQLLQFDKSYRPAFYGIWPNQSKVVGPRHPLRKDPDLDYDVDSDEEWEEEEPGESLSDCEKDEDENLDEECTKGDDEDESEDGFFVPDGYLSEDEGVQVDRTEMDPLPQEDRVSEEFGTFFRQQKILHSLTEHALKKNQPLIICNLTHEKTLPFPAKDLDGALKHEQTCLQALSIRTFGGSPLIEISVDSIQDENQDASNLKNSTPSPSSSAKPLPDLDLPTVVSVIRSCSQGMNKVVETLQQKFPDVSKTQLRNKVREISDFEDNRWQVKKHVLSKLGLSPSPDKIQVKKHVQSKLGLSPSPDKVVARTKTIASFFSKRCLPPSKVTNPVGSSSPQPSTKPDGMTEAPYGMPNSN